MSTANVDEQIERLRKGSTLPENEVKDLCDKVSKPNGTYVVGAKGTQNCVARLVNSHSDFGLYLQHSSEMLYGYIHPYNIVVVHAFLVIVNKSKDEK
jgi:hypothetical protein